MKIHQNELKDGENYHKNKNIMKAMQNIEV